MRRYWMNNQIIIAIFPSWAETSHRNVRWKLCYTTAIANHIYAFYELKSENNLNSLLYNVQFSVGLGIRREVNVEPGLFEWLGWYIAGVPKFLAVQELQDRSLTVNTSYTPIWPLSKYNVQETTEQFYERSYQVTKDILKKHEDEGLCCSWLELSFVLYHHCHFQMLNTRTEVFEKLSH